MTLAVGATWTPLSSLSGIIESKVFCGLSASPSSSACRRPRSHWKRKREHISPYLLISNSLLRGQLYLQGKKRGQIVLPVTPKSSTAKGRSVSRRRCSTVSNTAKRPSNTCTEVSTGSSYMKF
ncbi:uncharacterized protein LOC129006776 [Pongo pygmaeus]|uniref:uncharacterized protein LOC129006776 n=1 Tax=Pongo pygmaeus TaxID=9600 RepID=UPI0001D5F3B1|nr:uncharacterized protein LOC100452615 [Pongo abelii]XP_054292839.1 uncharacterized protein LOC129006776 [Pongo pygmaeus]